jgi:hypothetical protein
LKQANIDHGVVEGATSSDATPAADGNLRGTRQVVQALCGFRLVGDPGGGELGGGEIAVGGVGPVQL